MYFLIIISIIIAISACIVAGGERHKRYESHLWNGGVCPFCGCRWRYTDTDSIGRRMYRDDTGHYCIIESRIDKKK